MELSRRKIDTEVSLSERLRAIQWEGFKDDV